MKRLTGILLLFLIFVACTAEMPSGELPQEPPVILRYESVPSRINQDESALIAWDITGASIVKIDPGVGEMPSNGSMQVAPNETTIYTIYAENKAGTVSKSLTLNVVDEASITNGNQANPADTSKIPAMPELVSPINGSVFSHFPRTVNFKWRPSKGNAPISYVLQVQYDIRESPGAYQGYYNPIILSNIEYSLDFKVSGNGRWCVMAKNDFGASDYCDWWYFQFTK